MSVKGFDLTRQVPHEVIDVLAFTEFLLGLCLCFRSQRIMRAAPFSLLVGAFGALVVYQVFFGSEKFLGYGIGSLLNDGVKLFGLWNLVIIIGMAVTVYTTFFRQMCLIIAAGEMGWLLSGPAFLVIQALLEALHGSPGVADDLELFLFRCCFSLLFAVGWAIAVVKRPGSLLVGHLPAACASLVGAFFIASSMDHFMYDFGITHGQCFWPDVRLATYARLSCDISSVAFLLIASTGIGLQWWQDPPMKQTHYAPLPGSERERVRRVWAGLQA